MHILYTVFSCYSQQSILRTDTDSRLNVLILASVTVYGSVCACGPYGVTDFCHLDFSESLCCSYKLLSSHI